MAKVKTQAELAEVLGVSQMTISRALNSKPGLSESLRRRILRKAEEKSYRNNRVARSLVVGKTHILGLVIPCVTNSFYADLTTSIENTAKAYGYHVILCHTHENYEREKDEVELLRELRVDGLIVTPAFDEKSKGIYRELQENGVPFVLLDAYVEGLEANFVGSDDRAGAYEAVSHLIELGHRRIAHIVGPRNASPAATRLEGYRDALRRHGIPFVPDLVRERNFDETEGGYTATKELLTLKERPTAIFCVTDIVAIGVVQCLQEKKLRIPEDVALIGYGDVKSAAVLDVPLTTVNQSTREMGRMATQILIEEMEGGIKEPRKIFLHPRLIIRKSCGVK